MPLMRCPDCHKEISESAISCPNCGLPRPLYELQNRERRAAEDLAEESRRKKIQLMYAIAGWAALITIIILVQGIRTPWTMATLASKGRHLLGIAVGGGVTYGFFRYARILSRTPE